MAFEIGRLEASSPYLLADLIELIALLQFDGRSSYRPDDIASVIEGEPNFDEIEPKDLLGNIGNAWTHLEYRVGQFGTAYPFTLNDRGIRVRKRLAANARIYRLLLACSRLRSFDGTHRVRWAATFTRLSREVLAQLMPSWAHVRVFDANSEDRQGHFGTDLRDALVKLGKDLAASITDEDECRAQHSSGDAGIDLVGTATWDDEAPGVHAILGQCAARETEWPDKRLEAHPLRTRGMFSLLAEPVNAVFIPVLFRDTNGNWVTKTPASGCVLIDRLRILSLLNRRGRLGEIVNEPWFQAFETQFEDVRASIVPVAA